jgi:DNA polymerase-4
VIEVAKSLQLRIKEEIGLSASLGVASNKLVAKVASDQGKPGGLPVVRPGEEASFLAPLPVRLLGVAGRELSPPTGQLPLPLEREQR